MTLRSSETPILTDAGLTSGNLDDFEDPFQLFEQWFAQAREKEINDPEAMALATVDADGLPDVRMVLCKGTDGGALTFYTNGESAKGRQIEGQQKAAALFHWKSLRRQARFRGPVTRLDEAASDAYFRTRPRGSRIGAWASQQSRPLESRTALALKVAEYTAKFGLGDIPRPDYWRGYRITPVEIELWADGAFRLHDRIRFTRKGDGWSRQRLYP